MQQKDKAAARVGDGSKLTVFISYARADATFADAVVSALEKFDIQVLIDRRDLPFGEQWKPELLDFVRRADAIVFVASPRSIAAKWCTWELEQVAAEHKRLVPILLEQVAISDLPRQIADIHLLSFTSAWDGTAAAALEPFDTRIETLARVLLTDRQWVKDHTRLGDLARRFADVRSRLGPQGAEALLLRGHALSEAELWLLRRPREAPAPTEQQITVIRESRRAEQARADAEASRARRRVIIASLAAVLAAAAAVVISFLYSRSSHNLGLALATKSDQLLVEERPTQALMVATSARQTPLVEAAWSIAQRLAPALVRPGDETVRIRTIADVAGRGAVAPLQMLKADSAATAVAFAPQGDQFAVGFRSGKIALGHASRPGDTILFAPNSRRIMGLQFTPDGRQLIAATTQVISILDVATGNVAHSMCVQDNSLYAIATDPSGRHLAAISSAGQLTVWDMSSWQLAKSFQEHAGEGLSVDFSRDGSLIASSGYDGTVRIRSTADWSQLPPIKTGHSDLISIAFSPDGRRLAAASIGGPVEVWTLGDGARSVQRLQVPGPPDRRWAVRFSPDGRMIAVASWDGSVRFWDADSLQYVGTIDAHDHWVNAIALSADSQFLAAAVETGAARVWNVKDVRSMFHTIQDEPRETLVGRYSPDGNWFAAGGRNGRANLYQVDAAGRLAYKCLVEHAGWIQSLDFSSDSTRVISAGTHVGSSENVLRIWSSTDRCRLLHDIQVGRPVVRSVTFSPSDNSVAWSNLAGELWLARPESDYRPKMLARLLHAGGRQVTFHPDGKILAAGSINGGLEVFEIATGKRLRQLSGHRQSTLTVRFSPDGRWLASGGPDEYILIWDLSRPEGQELVHRLEVQGGSNHLAFSPDSARLSVGSDARYVATWDTTTWHKVFQLHAGVGVRSVFDYHPKRLDLAFDGENGVIRILLQSKHKHVTTKDIDAAIEGVVVRFDNVSSTIDALHPVGGAVDVQAVCRVASATVRN